MSDLQSKLDSAGKEIQMVRTAKAETQKKLEKSEGELAAAREQTGVLTSIEDQLQARCNTLQSDLTELRENPRIPLEYKNQVQTHPT